MLFFSKCPCGYRLLLLCFFIINSLHTSAASLKAAREEQGQAGFLGTSVAWWGWVRAGGVHRVSGTTTRLLFCIAFARLVPWSGWQPADQISWHPSPEGHPSHISYHMLLRELGLMASLRWHALDTWGSAVIICNLKCPQRARSESIRGYMPCSYAHLRWGIGAALWVPLRRKQLFWKFSAFSMKFSAEELLK